jgi:hypothetical protein
VPAFCPLWPAFAIQQHLNVGLVDALSIALAPVFFGAGRRLLESIDPQAAGLEIVEALHSPYHASKDDRPVQQTFWCNGCGCHARESAGEVSSEGHRALGCW